MPDEYPLFYAAQTVGITLYEVHDVIIRDLTVQGFQLDGINAHDCAKDCQLIGVIARGNGRAGIAVGGASNVRIKSCLLSDNGDEQILTDGPSTTSIEQSDIDSAPRAGPRPVAQGHRILRRAAPDRHARRNAAGYRDSVIVAGDLWPFASAALGEPCRAEGFVPAGSTGPTSAPRAYAPVCPRCMFGFFPGCVDVAAPTDVEHDAHDGDRDRDGPIAESHDQAFVRRGNWSPPGTI